MTHGLRLTPSPCTLSSFSEVLYSEDRASFTIRVVNVQIRNINLYPDKVKFLQISL